MVKKKQAVSQSAKNEEVEELKNQLTHAMADYDNLKKRYERERMDIIQRANEQLLTDLLPVLDLFETVKSYVEDKGLALAVDQFKRVLSDSGVEEIKPQQGETFDAHKHEVIDVVSGDEENKGKIAECVATGLQWDDGRLIMAARVRVFGEEIEDKDKEEIQKELERGDYA